MGELDEDYCELNQRVWDLVKPPDNDDERNRQFQALLGLVMRLIQEVEALKSILNDNGLLESHKKVLLEKMIGDHGGPGPSPYERSTFYPYLMPEAIFLREHLELSDDEIAAFNKQARLRASLT